MNPTNELLINTSKESMQSISTAFRKLLERVTSAQLRSKSTSRNIRRGSNSSAHNEQLHRKKKTSVSLFHSRKNSYFFKKGAQPTQKTSRGKEGVNEGGCKQNKSNNGLKEKQYTSVRCHSDPSVGNTNSLYKRINDHNQMLITKTYVFDELAPQTTSKSGHLRSFFRKNVNPKAFNHTDINFDYNRARPCDDEHRNNKHLKTGKNWKIHAKPKSSFFKAVQLDPWQTDKPQQESFIEH